MKKIHIPAKNHAGIIHDTILKTTEREEQQNQHTLITLRE